MDSSVGAALAGLVGADTWMGAGVSASRVRDLVVVDLGAKALVIACDSNAATGDKPGDYLKQDPIITGYSAAKVPLMEVLASGAVPFLLVNNLCCDLATTGVRILAGIRELLDQTGVDLMVTGSDESNMPTVQTGLGVTVIGIVDKEALRLGGVRAGDEVWVVGLRRSGIPNDEYDEGDGGTGTAIHVKTALELPGVHEVLPVGSHGVAHEVGELARVGEVSIDLREGLETDLHASAGASTCFLVACDPQASARLRELDLPLELVGEARALAD
ncbi:hypothetical protein BH10ACT7_BH10ACT7_32800 [soil metagenome]